MRAPDVSWLTPHKRRPPLALLSERASRALTGRQRGDSSTHNGTHLPTKTLGVEAEPPNSRTTGRIRDDTFDTQLFLCHGFPTFLTMWLLK
ncbi:hypothetical protein EYF80_034513 [Liparis tanakae]|uniref:Uncharacterized protein n=1 Tax=Liparis tanakae TaxID=230148 RepID=A0A4Z2GNW7_9TELE|nr:hypothetical protein EYF80_034513 [Liparis tanakae]